MDLSIAALLNSSEFRVDAAPVVAGADAQRAAGGVSAGGFGKALGNALESLEASQAASTAQSDALVSGQATDPTSVVMAVERASLELQLATQFRNKAVDAYQEIFRMQI